MVIKKQEKGKKSPSKEKQQTTIAPTPEEISIALALAQALGSPHDEESFRLSAKSSTRGRINYNLCAPLRASSIIYNVHGSALVA